MFVGCRRVDHAQDHPYSALPHRRHETVHSVRRLRLSCTSFLHSYIIFCFCLWSAVAGGGGWKFVCVFFGNNKLINCKRFGKCWRVASGETIYNSIAANSTTWSTANNISGFALFYFSTVRVNCCFWSVSVSAFSTACACASLAFFPLVIFIQL